MYWMDSMVKLIWVKNYSLSICDFSAFLEYFGFHAHIYPYFGFSAHDPWTTPIMIITFQLIMIETNLTYVHLLETLTNRFRHTFGMVHMDGFFVSFIIEIPILIHMSKIVEILKIMTLQNMFFHDITYTHYWDSKFYSCKWLVIIWLIFE